MATQYHELTIIKRRGQRTSERFAPEKLHTSVQAACLSVRTPEGEAQLIAKRVVDAVMTWSKHKSSVTSDDIRRIAARGLELFHPDAAYLYQHHQLVV